MKTAYRFLPPKGYSTLGKFQWVSIACVLKAWTCFRPRFVIDVFATLSSQAQETNGKKKNKLMPDPGVNSIKPYKDNLQAQLLFSDSKKIALL